MKSHQRALPLATDLVLESVLPRWRTAGSTERIISVHFLTNGGRKPGTQVDRATLIRDGGMTPTAIPSPTCSWVRVQRVPVSGAVHCKREERRPRSKRPLFSTVRYGPGGAKNPRSRVIWPSLLKVKWLIPSKVISAPSGVMPRPCHLATASFPATWTKLS